MSTQLIIHNVLFLFGGLINIGIAIFVLYSTRKNWKVTPVTFAFSSLAVAVFQFSHLLGTNASDPAVSRSILMFNLTDIWIGMFMTHWFLGFIGKNVEKRFALGVVYGTGITIFLACLAFPRMFLVDSVQKLYFPNYYEPGPFYYLMFFWFLLVSIYHFYQLIRAFRNENDVIQKKRFKFVLIAMVYAYIFGTTAFLLVFDIPFNPVLSSLFGLYPLIIAYSILQYEVFNIQIFAKRAFVYAVAIFSVGLIITISNYLGEYFLGIEPNLPTWVAPALMSLLLGTGSMYIWRKAREAYVAKYEFITVVTHKFRTPLTRIRWSAEELVNAVPADKKSAVDAIFQSERQLLELTNILVQLSETDARHFNYKPVPIDLREFLSKIKNEYDNRASQKNLTLNLEVPENIKVNSDEEKLVVVFQILMDNALNYTHSGGSVSIKAYPGENGTYAVVEVTDTGIGISRESIGQIFSRFYRGHKARLADTEGMGIGLFMAKNILEKQGGKIWAESEGDNKGSTFYIRLPLLVKSS